MSLINDYTYQAMTDQQERDFARLAEQNRRVRLALSGRESWWRRMLSGADSDASPSRQRPAERNGDAPAPGRALSATGARRQDQVAR